jgi:hypothetical protein
MTVLVNQLIGDGLNAQITPSPSSIPTGCHSPQDHSSDAVVPAHPGPRPAS